jgi:hypothetical protein
MTYGDLYDRLARLGIAPPEPDPDVTSVFDEEADKVTGVIFAELGVAVFVEGLDGDVVDAYLEVIETAVALGNGVLTDVTREAETLSFRVDGRPVTWEMDAHSSGELIFSWTYIWGQLHKLVPGGDDPREFYSVEDDVDDSTTYLLLTGEQAEALRAEYGLDLQTVPYSRSDGVR